MNPATLALIVQGIEAAIAAAPKVIAIAEKGKALITSLFEAGVITIEQQKTVHDHVDSIMNAALAGETPPAWTVEADPGTASDALSNATSMPSGAPASAAPGTFAPIPAETQSKETIAAEKSAVESAPQPDAAGGSPS